MELKKVLVPNSKNDILKKIKSSHANQVLESCVKRGSLPGVIKAINQGADVNHEWFLSKSVLCKAIEYNHVEIVRYLIEQGAIFSYDELLHSLKYPDLLEELLDIINPAKLSIEDLRKLYDIAFRKCWFRSASKIRTKLVLEMKYIYEF